MKKSSSKLACLFQTEIIIFCFRDKVPKIFNARQLSDYCPEVVKDRKMREKAKADAKAKKQSENGGGKKGPKNCWNKKKGRRKCFEREEARCSRKRARWDASDPRLKEPCTQKERDAAFGKNWRWNTRNCAALDKVRGEGKRCRREKRKRCIRRLMTTSSNASLSESDAKQVCKRKGKKKAKKI